MRLFFLLLVFANLIFFAGMQGYFGSGDNAREPLRLAQQLHPEKLRVVPVVPQPVTNQEEIGCRMVTGLTVVNAEVLGSAVAAAGGKAKLHPVALPELHEVFIGDLAGKAAVDKKLAELARLQLDGHKVVALGDERHEISLGEFQTDVAAREFLLQLSRRGVKSARIEVRAQTPVTAQVEVRAPESLLQRQLPQLVAPHTDAVLGECPA